MPGEIWYFGETGLFSPLCGVLKDYGLKGKASIPWDSLGFNNDGAVYDIAFDAGDPDIVYATSSCGILKTSDGGYAWEKNVLQIPDDGFVYHMINHPFTGGVLFLAGGRQIYATLDAGRNVQKIGEISTGFISSLVWGATDNEFFIGTTEGGVYSLTYNIGW